MADYLGNNVAKLYHIISNVLHIMREKIMSLSFTRKSIPLVKLLNVLNIT